MEKEKEEVIETKEDDNTETKKENIQEKEQVENPNKPTEAQQFTAVVNALNLKIDKLYEVVNGLTNNKQEDAQVLEELDAFK